MKDAGRTAPLMLQEASKASRFTLLSFVASTNCIETPDPAAENEDFNIPK